MSELKVTCMNCRYSMRDYPKYFCCYYRKYIWTPVEIRTPEWCNKFKNYNADGEKE